MEVIFFGMRFFNFFLLEDFLVCDKSFFVTHQVFFVKVLVSVSLLV